MAVILPEIIRLDWLFILPFMYVVAAFDECILLAPSQQLPLVFDAALNFVLLRSGAQDGRRLQQIHKHG